MILQNRHAKSAIHNPGRTACTAMRLDRSHCHLEFDLAAPGFGKHGLVDVPDIFYFSALGGGRGSLRCGGGSVFIGNPRRRPGGARVAGVLRGNTIRGNTTRNSKRRMAL